MLPLQLDGDDGYQNAQLNSRRQLPQLRKDKGLGLALHTQHTHGHEHVLDDHNNHASGLRHLFR